VRVKPPILERLRGVQTSGDGWVAFCPAHRDESKRSLSVKVAADGKTLLHCFVGCPVERITSAVEMRVGDLGASAATGTNGSGNGHVIRRREIAAYDYRDERGELLYQVVRFDPKDFRPRRPDGAGGWTWDLKGVRRVVYRLDELAEQRRVFLVEGEKDADRLRALDLPATTTPSGAESWRDEYAQQIRAAGVEEAVIIPDNDPAGRKYASTAGAALAAAGVAVRVVSLPGLAPKADVSDWLDAGHAADELTALAENAAAFDPAAFGVTNPDTDPQLQRQGFDLILEWSDGAKFLLTAIRDSRDGIRGELTVYHGPKRLSWGSFSLSSTQARESLRKKLEGSAPGTPWGEYLEEASYRLTRAAREGDPIVRLTGVVASPTRELVPRLLYEGEPTLVYADGDTGKSLFALTLAAAIHSGAALPLGLKPARAVPAAYLDWETGVDTMQTRLALVAAGLGIRVPPIIYKRMTRPLVDEIGPLAAEFARLGVGLVIIDSKMFAVGGGDGAAFHEPITAFYGALRLFGSAASLVLNHVTNADARVAGPARPFGGAFAFNGPRLIWEAKRDKDITDATAIAFTCTKANNLPRRPEPFGLRFEPTECAIAIHPFDLTNAAPQAVASASVGYRIRLALASNDMTSGELAEHLSVGENHVRTELSRLAKSGRVHEAGTNGRAKVWRLSA
jgi:hypothetical protein